MLTGSNLVHTKQYNLRLVQEVIRQHGPLSRSDIARRTELTVQTVSNLIKELLAYGLVYEAERRRKGRGAPSTELALNPEGAFSIGLDLDRDHLSGVLVDLTGSVRQHRHMELNFPSPEEAVKLMVQMTDALITAQGLRRDNVRGVGIGISGPMHQTQDGSGYVVSPRAFPGWHGVPLADLLHEELGMPVFLENNATAAAIGERWYGAGQRFRTFFYLYFGSGLGGGLIIDGRPFEGYSGNAGEIAYLPAKHAEPSPAGEDPFHVGMHFYLPRLYARLREAGEEAYTSEDLERLLTAGHPILREWIDTAVEEVTGLALAVEYLMDPEVIFFGGRLPTPFLERLMNAVAERLPAHRVRRATPAPRYLLATAGVDAAALGVATLPIYEFFAPSLEVLLKQAKGQRLPTLNTRLAAFA